MAMLWLAAWLLLPAGQAQPGAGADPRRAFEQARVPKVLWRRDVVLPGGRDHGQHLATVLEVRNGAGRTLLAAGFVNGGQTGAINNHRALNVHVDSTLADAGEATAGPGVPRLAPLALAERPFAAGSLFVLTTFRGQLLAHRRSGFGPIKRWSIDSHRWETLSTRISRTAETNRLVSLQVVGNELLAVYSNKVIYGDMSLDISAIDGADHLSFETSLYFNGRIYLSAMQYPGTAAQSSFFMECRWAPGREQLHPCERVRLNLPSADENRLRDDNLLGIHALADGQVLVYGLTGYLYVYRQGQLRPLVDAVANRSWQVYSTIERYGRLLLGHYPSGNIVELSLSEHLSDKAGSIAWADSTLNEVQMRPPVLAPGPVLRDEVQSMMLFGDTVLLGMWPWGEIYAGRPGGAWRAAVPSLTGLEPTVDLLHPYERQTGNNCLGMRIFQIVPWRGGAVFQTTIKIDDAACLKASSDVAAAAVQPYGQVYYVDLPGHLSCDLPWSTEPRRLSITVTDDDRLHLESGGHPICSRGVDARRLVAALRRPDVRSWAMPAVGLYGRRTQVDPDGLR
jgi:hypothetical protein